jgi:membrane-bound lytic murein transglycosylase D
MQKILKSTVLFLGLLLFISLGIIRAQDIPQKITYCGMELTLTRKAREKLKSEVVKLQASPRYFNQMVARAQLFFPYIEQAFRKHKVPSDLKYLSIQESSLRAHAVSSSNAVGYWQFKAPTALEMGLTINDEIDERRHIYRSSEAAAIYIKEANYDFSNWIYAIIAYNQGPTGAIKHTRYENYGVKKMKIDEDLHWYVMKAIAHKLAYEDAIKSAKPLNETLEMMDGLSGINLNKVAKKTGLSRKEFLIWNPWVLSENKLPKYEGYYFLPSKKELPKNNGSQITKEPVVFQKPAPQPSNEASRDEGKAVTPTTPSPTKPREGSPIASYPRAINSEALQPNAYASFPLQKDIHYSIQFIQYNGSLTVAKLADIYKVNLSDLLLWNNLVLGKEPKQGSILYLNKPKKCEFHIVQPGENLASIASYHRLSVKKIQKQNRMNKDNPNIYIGQKLYLKAKKPKGERLIILHQDRPQQPEKTQKAIQKQEEKSSLTPQPQKARNIEMAKEKEIEEVEEVKTIWVEHTVQQGETLWGISQKYDTKVEIIKSINKLNGDSIHEGQVLKILAKR